MSYSRRRGTGDFHPNTPRRDARTNATQYAYCLLMIQSPFHSRQGILPADRTRSLTIDTVKRDRYSLASFKSFH
ncbi:hypothetical protein VNO77_20697 [Canavalia gladiata]|uniref:Uncharacterized protein n=1 Tax=Canavalia gladiata TaxID=3824 RepID=A0AAN9LQ14_CANGL